jgi:hypothetical protein
VQKEGREKAAAGPIFKEKPEAASKPAELSQEAKIEGKKA